MERKHLAIALMLLVLLGGVCWALFTGEDTELAEVKQLRDDMLTNMDNMSDEQRRASRDAFRERAQNLSEEQRRELGRGFRDFMMQRVDALIAMPREQQVAELDRWIDRMEERRQQGGPRPGGGEGDRERRGGGDMSSAERDQRRKERLERSSPEDRAKRALIRNLIAERRQQRGLGPGRGMGWR